jgi:hypothetical protein
VKFIGCVLWSDCSEENKQFVTSSLNDYKYIKNENEKLTVDDTVGWFKESLQFIKEEIEDCKKNNQKCIILTHHAPLKNLGSSEPTFYGGAMNDAFCSDLRLLMGSPILLWAYGHTHYPQDMIVNGTRVISNPSGYNIECSSYQPKHSIPIFFE